ncbi:adenylate/guanylate cyclase domain-containing protein [Rhodovibrionaceae bacterium A322]
MARTFSTSWSHRFSGPLEDVWSFIADSSRYNEATGFPKHKIEPEIQADGSTRFFGSVKVGWFTLKWEDFPADWVTPERYFHPRIFSQGPLQKLDFEFRLEPDGDGCIGTFQLDAVSRGLFGWLMLKSGKFHHAAERDCRKFLTELDEFLQQRRQSPFDYIKPQPDDSAIERGARLAREIEASGYGHGLADKLVDFVLTGPENDLSPLRPLHLAHLWQAEERQVVELCLQATKVGLISLEWAILCPRCQMPDETYRSLDEMPHGAHCPFCNISFDGDFSANVELSFKPSPAIRDVGSGLFCFSGPLGTPHILMQQRVAAGQTRDLALKLPPGSYRVRSHDPGPERSFEVLPNPRNAASDQEVTLVMGRDKLDLIAAGSALGDAPLQKEDRALHLPALSRLIMTNESDRARSFVVERLAWRAEALTADRVTTYQAFRDLFSDQVLRAGDQVGISRVALLFSDLYGSTALYERIGDARAYALVREHFAFMAGIIRDQEGAVVKTIGDAVMAAFHSEEQALLAGLAIQQQIAQFNQANPDGPLAIKLGLHAGPAIAVTLNERLDYFGSTVNLAARLQAQSQGGDFVLSQPVAELPDIQKHLTGFSAQSETAPLKGFAEPVPFLRLQF